MKFENDHYTIQGIDVHAICAEFGTPLYVYDADYIAGQVKQFKAAFSGVRARLKYACKAASNVPAGANRRKQPRLDRPAAHLARRLPGHQGLSPRALPKCP